MESKKIIKIIIIAILIIVFADQLSKALVYKLVSQDIQIIPNIFSITRIENEGMAFGFNKQNIVNIFIMIIVLLFIFRYIIKQKKHMNSKIIIFLSLIIAGGISNLIDRIFRGAVFDFLKMGSFPIFNFADICICIGWILFVINFILYSTKEFK